MKHDESTDVRMLGRKGVKVCSVPTAHGTVKCMVITPALKPSLGIKSWGRVDYLQHYCGYHILKAMPNSGVTINKTTNPNAENAERRINARELKKQKKMPKLTDKTKKKK